MTQLINGVSKFTAMGEHENDWICENELARTLKVERAVLRKKRPYLPPGEVQQKNGAVQWLRTAAERVASELGMPMALEAAGGPSDTPAQEVMIVITQAVNRNIIYAQRANGDRVCVRVIDNRKYVPRLGNGQPMKLTAKKSTAGNWWLLVGREPRWPGVY